jgi:ornithine cyclodeaminase/alanine dehydrogenase-like protein (mu-crystallin family)
MLVLSAEEIQAALPMDQAIAAMKRVYAALSAGAAHIPHRVAFPVTPEHNDILLVMPGRVTLPGENALAIKLLTLFPKNPERGVPYIQGSVLVLDPENGRLLALLEGGALTAIRTGAGSGAATDLLARPEARAVALFGAGHQARTQLEAVCTVRAIETVFVVSRRRERAEQFVAEVAGQGRVPRDVRIADSPRQALAEVDIVCTATTAAKPVFQDNELPMGTHINAIGSYTPDVQEIPAETVRRALVFVDSRQAALAEAGDLLEPISRGLLSPDHIHAELGEVVLGRKSGRHSQDQITLFKSVGSAVQDVVAAREALQNAQAAGLGQQVKW